jgi:hypothetical protein
MFTACPTTSAKGEDARPTVFMTKRGVGSTDLSHFFSTINCDRKALTTKSLMKGNHGDWFALNNVLWLKQLRASNDANDQKYNRYLPTPRNEKSPSFCRGLHYATFPTRRRK